MQAPRWLLALLLIASCGKSSSDYIERGKRFHREGNYVEAELNFRNAIQKDPKSAEAVRERAKTLLKLRREYEAVQQLRTASHLDPSNLDAKILLTDILLTAYIGLKNPLPGLYSEASRLIDEINAAKPGSYDALRLRGAIASADRNWPVAIDAFRKAAEISPAGSYDALLGLANSLYRGGQTAEAEALLNKRLQADPRWEPGYDLRYRLLAGAGDLNGAAQILETKYAATKNDLVLVEIAEHHSRAGKPELMSAALQRIPPSASAEVQIRAGDFQTKLANWDEAVRRYEAGMASDSARKTEFQKRIVNTHISRGQKAEALRYANTALQQEAGDVELRMVRAVLLADSGTDANLQQAIRELTELTGKQPDHAVLRYNLGATLLRANRTAEAAVELKRALQRRRDYVAPRVLLAEIGIIDQNPADTRRFAQEAVDLQPTNARARLLLAIGLTNAGLYNEARNELGKLLKQEPKSIDAKLQLGLVAVAEKKFAEAESAFREIYTPGNSDLRAVIGITTSLIQRKQFDAALAILEREPKGAASAGVQRAMSQVAMAAGRPDVAIQLDRKLLAAGPKSPAVMVHLADALQAKGELTEAIRTLEQATQAWPAESAILLRLAAAREAAGQFEPAKAAYRQLLARNPDSIEALNNLSMLLAENDKDLDEALEHARRALAKDPGRPEIRDTVAWIQLRKNDAALALPSFQALARKYPQSAIYRYHLGVALLKQGDRTGAATELRSALANTSDAKLMASVNQVLSTIERR